MGESWKQRIEELRVEVLETMRRRDESEKEYVEALWKLHCAVNGITEVVRP